MFYHMAEAETVISIGIGLASAVACGLICALICKLFQTWNFGWTSSWDSPVFSLRFTTGIFNTPPGTPPKPTFNSSPDDLQQNTPVIDSRQIYKF